LHHDFLIDELLEDIQAKAFFLLAGGLLRSARRLILVVFVDFCSANRMAVHFGHDIGAVTSARATAQKRAHSQQQWWEKMSANRIQTRAPKSIWRWDDEGIVQYGAQPGRPARAFVALKEFVKAEILRSLCQCGR
jgi:hypothetical protein